MDYNSISKIPLLHITSFYLTDTKNNHLNNIAFNTSGESNFMVNLSVYLDDDFKNYIASIPGKNYIICSILSNNTLPQFYLDQHSIILPIDSSIVEMGYRVELKKEDVKGLAGSIESVKFQASYSPTIELHAGFSESLRVNSFFETIIPIEENYNE